MSTASEKLQIALTNQEVKLMKEQNSIDHNEIKQDVCSIKDDIKDLKNYVVKVVENKADKSAVDALYKGIWSVALIGISSFIGMIVWLFQKN